MKSMRAKVTCTKVITHSPTHEEVFFTPVCKDGGYPADGSDENNTFARFSPSGEFRLMIANPALLGAYRPDPSKAYYVDFTPVS